MKMFLGNTPIKSLHIKHYEMDTNSATVLPSDLQSGVTCFARGQKITGTGKAFSFATYGSFLSKTAFPVPTSEINTILIGANGHVVKMRDTTLKLREIDFSTAQEIAYITIDGVEYPITLQIANNILTMNCNQSVTIQALFGKDDYT